MINQSVKSQHVGPNFSQNFCQEKSSFLSVASPMSIAQCVSIECTFIKIIGHDRVKKS